MHGGKPAAVHRDRREPREGAMDDVVKADGEALTVAARRHRGDEGVEIGERCADGWNVLVEKGQM